ncbi:MAG: cation transporter [Coriobacteriaceae bacterium]|jgi:Cu+-exporting ATPase|nr:cation transporter [Coriobacteriaceae bacterium]
MEKMVLKVSGMKCERCTAKVESALIALAGVSLAQASHISGEVEVTHDGSIALESLAAAIREAGFEVA